MVRGDDLGGLRVALATARSPLERVKVVARAWRTVRRLGPEQRRTLAATLGFDGAQELVERIATRGRLNPNLLLRGLEHLKGSDPSELRGLLRGLGDRRRRGELLRRGLEVAADRLDLPGLEPESAGPPATDAPAPEPVEAAAPDAAAAPRPLAGPSVEAPPLPPRPVPAAVAGESRSVASPPAAAVERPAGEPAAASERTTPPAPARSQRAAPPPVVVAAAPAALIERVGAAAGPMRRLRLARQGIAEAGGLDDAQLARLLDLFPEEWARRRVLCALLEERIPADLERALGLIGRLSSATSRRWCLAVLRHRWPLSPQEERRIEDWTPAASGRGGAGYPRVHGAGGR